MAHNAGDSVSALIAESNIATATVTANCRNSTPDMPGNSYDRCSDFAHRLFSRLTGRELGMFFHHPLNVFDHNNGVINHNADRQHYGQQRYRIARIADGEQRDESSNEADRYGKGWYQSGAHTAEEQKDDDNH